MLNNEIKQQLITIFEPLKANYVFRVHVSKEHEKRDELISLLNGVAECSDKITVDESEGESLSVELDKDDKPLGVIFRCIPSGHEFNSLLLAILNADGIGKNLPDEFTINRIKALKTPIKLSTYMLLSCTKCPDVVQALNIVAIYNDGVTHEVIDGNLFLDDARAHDVHAVPTVFADDSMLHVGRSNMGELLVKLEDVYGSNQEVIVSEAKNYEALILGGGPAGATAAIYLARKGIKTALITDRVGGQVNDTVGIENILSIENITGDILSKNMLSHLEQHDIDIFNNRTIESVETKDDAYHVSIKGGELFNTSVMIIATGAKWRRLNIPGEERYLNRGISFCPHCDGPLFKDKSVAVIGGGNSGVEVALDLSHICKNITIIEYMEDLKADKILVERAKERDNIDIITNCEVIKIGGDKQKVASIITKRRDTNSEEELPLDGVFIQIGLSPNTSIFEGLVELNNRGEVVVDRVGRTSSKGIYAVGDVTDITYKQVVIAMGEGAKGALAAYDDFFLF